MNTADSIAVGALIDGRYELGLRLGEGAFGEVWRAHDRRLAGRLVAVKFLRLEHMERPELVARFDAEAGALALVQHPNVVAVLDRGEWRGRRFLVTEFVEGLTLAAWLQRHRDERRLPDLETVRQLFDQVCAGVESAHAVRSPGAIVHRDLKPDNVIVRATPGGDLAVKVLDFGIAQLGGRGATRTGMLLGTPGYMAPEQAMGQTAGIGAFTDVFALGVLLTEMLTLSVHPRGEETWWAVALRDGGAVHSLLAGRRGDVPPAVWSVVATTLIAEGASRPPHAGALRAALRGAWPASASLPPTMPRTVAMNPPGPAAPPFPPSRPWSETKATGGASPWSLAVPAALGVCLVAALAVRFVHVHRRPAPPDVVAATDAATDGATDPALPAMLDAARIPVGASPTLGPATALVTVVEFADFQCPFSARVQDTLRQVREHYGDDVRVVWKNAPLPFHVNARPAAEAAMEAFRQGGDAKFWQMHDLLFANQQSLDAATLERFAGQIGLDVSRFRAALSEHAHAAAVEDDGALAQALGAEGTPAFFVNGTPLTGAQPYDRFRVVLDGVLAAARTVQPRERAYAAMVADPVRESGAAPIPAPIAPAEDNRVYAVRDARHAPGFGPARARVVVHLFADYQCRFSARVNPVVERIRREYGDRVRLVWRDYVLPFHADAMLAAEAAREAFAQQGNEGFWRYHDRLFANQQRLGRADLERYAAEQGLDPARFRAALDGHTHRRAIRLDMEAGDASGALIGTPSFFINGRLLQGAFPYEVFQTRLDAALAGR